LPAAGICFLIGLGAAFGSFAYFGLVLGPIAVLLGFVLSGRTSKAARFLTGLGMVLGILGFTLSLELLPQGTADDSAFSEWIGKKAPDFKLVDTTGTTQRLSDYRGRRVFLVFWGVNCPPCLREIPRLKALVRSLPEEKFQILAISWNPLRWLKKAVRSMKINYPVISSSEPNNEPGIPYSQVWALPTLMVVSPEGTFEKFHIGILSEEELLRLAKGT